MSDEERARRIFSQNREDESLLDRQRRRIARRNNRISELRRQIERLERQPTALPRRYLGVFGGYYPSNDFGLYRNRQVREELEEQIEELQDEIREIEEEVEANRPEAIRTHDRLLRERTRLNRVREQAFIDDDVNTLTEIDEQLRNLSGQIQEAERRLERFRGNLETGEILERRDREAAVAAAIRRAPMLPAPAPAPVPDAVGNWEDWDMDFRRLDEEDF